MENITSPTSPIPVNVLARPIERNVLKELNNIEGTTKSPKETALANEPEIHAKDSPLPVIVTNNCIAEGSEKVLATEAMNTLKGFAQSDSKEIKEIMQLGEKCNYLNETCTLTDSPGFLTGPQNATFVSTGPQDATFVSTGPQDGTFVSTGPQDGTFVSTGPQDATFVSTGPQDGTFVSSTKIVNNQTVVLGSNSSELIGKNVAKEYSDHDSVFAGSQLNQTQKISEFKSGQCLSTDSLELDGEAPDLSLDSPSIKQDEPTTPTDKRLPTVSAEKLFSSRKAPTFSEMFSGSSPSTIELNDVPNKFDASFVVEKSDVVSDKVSRKESLNATIVVCDIDDTVPVMEGDAVNGTFDFKEPTVPVVGKSNKPKKDADNFMVLNSVDFDFLQSRGSNSVDPEDDPRSSLLMRFDPLIKRRRSLHPTESKSPALEETHTTLTAPGSADRTITHDKRSPNEPRPSNGFLVEVADAMESDGTSCMNNVRIEKNGDKVIAVDELRLTNKKIDVTSVDENIRKKMEEYEATQEILLKRITEKDKAITKASNVLELYEKAIAEALAAKEKLSQNYDKEHEELKSDRDVDFQHLLSLESTFADLHMKFERNVQYTGQLQEKLNAISEDKSKAEDLLRQQEFRYDKMKSHTMQQFDIANTKLEQQTRTISLENTKLRAQIKREEIHKNAVAEELSQKKRENEELVKICDELISGQRN